MQGISEAEKDELTHLIKHRYGYDFTNYSTASFMRRIVRFAGIKKISNFFDLKTELLNDSQLFAEFVLEVTVNTTEMFRDPDFFKQMKLKVFPLLHTYPFRKIWHAGCATGEEVYSMAITLLENELYDNTLLYATDINQKVLQVAREGIYPLKNIKDFEDGYRHSGGLHSFTDYYVTAQDKAVISSTLKRNIVFSQHDLVNDSSFNEFHLIVCRNVLIYFNRKLQEHVLQLFYESLAPLGFLALGTRESFLFSTYKDCFEVIDKPNKIYRKIK